MARMTFTALIASIDNLPPFPAVISEIMRLLDDEKTDAKVLEQAFMKDQALTVQLLKLANSAYYGTRSEITSVSAATVRLGFSAMKSMVMNLAVGPLLKQPLEGYGLMKDSLWRQSQLCAIASRIIAKRVGYKDLDQAYTAGLLKDIGKLILNEYMDDEMATINEMAIREHKDFLILEDLIIGFSHAKVGQAMGIKWRLPEVLTETIALHHRPDSATIDPQLVAIVHLADAMMMTMGFEIGLDGLDYVISSEALERLGLNESQLEELMSELIDYVNNETTFL